MARLPMQPAEPADPQLAAIFEEVRKAGVALPNLYRVLGNAPDMLRAWIDLAWPLRLKAGTPRRLRELLILRGSQISGAHYEWVHHVAMALAAGVPQAQIDALASWQESPLFDAVEKAVLRLAEEVTRGPAASEACIAELKRHFAPEAVVELVLTSAFYVCVARTLLSLDVDLEEGH
jgi:alkylhydroperoxidase family enzyme